MLNQGISEHTALSFGTANIVVAVCVLVVAWTLGARVGPGTIANAVLIGLFVDGLLAVSAIDALSDSSLAARILLMFAGVLVDRARARLLHRRGHGRRAARLADARRRTRTRIRIGVARAAIEIAVTVVGFALGGTVGIGTLVFAFGIGTGGRALFWLLERTPFADPSPACPTPRSG